MTLRPLRFVFGWMAFGFCLSASVLLHPQTALGQEAVEIRGGAHPGYSRIVFDFERPMGYSASIAGNRLLVRFERSVKGDPTAALSALRGTVSGAELDPDGRSVAFQLTGPVELRTFPMGAAVAIDLLPAQLKPPAAAPMAGQVVPAAASVGTANEPGSKPPSAPAAQNESLATRNESVRVPVRVGLHEGFERMVFDWARPVEYRVQTEGGRTTVVFDRPATVDLGEFAAMGPRTIDRPKAQAGDKETTVTFTIPENARVRHFRAGQKIVLDVMAPTEGPAPVAAGKERSSAKPVIPALTQAPSDAKAAARAPEPPKPTEPARETPAQEMKAKPPEPTKQQVPAPHPTAQPAPRSAPAPLEAQAEASVATAAVPAASSQAAPVSAERPDPSPQKSLSASGASVLTPAPVPPAGSSALSPLGPLTLRFVWDQPVGGALFQRAGAYWIVFDQPRSIDLAAIRDVAGALVGDLRQLNGRNATVLRFTMASSVSPTLRREGLVWLVDIKPQDPSPKTEIEPVPQPENAAGPRLFVPIQEVRSVVEVLDPEVGDRLLVAPTLASRHGITRDRGYAQFRLLPSLQGMVVQPLADGIEARVVRDGVEIISLDRLHISRPLPVVQPKPAAVSETAPPIVQNPLKRGARTAEERLFPLEDWRRGDLAAFARNEQDLMGAIATTRGDRRIQARLDLARFYVAHGLGAEAVGVLDLVQNEAPEALRDADVRALRGAASYLAGRSKEAIADLSAPELQAQDEAALWLAAARAEAGDFAGANSDFRRTVPLLRTYPPVLKERMGSLAAEAALAAGDASTAQNALGVLVIDNPEPDRAQAARLAYLEGRLKQLNGDLEGALTLLEQAELGPDRRARVRGALARLDIALKLGKITAPQAVESLERLRYAWRSDDFEFDLVRRLAEYHMAGGDYRSGLQTLKELAAGNPDNPKSADVAKQMSDIFADLYLRDAADALPPVTAIAIYEEFKELTPAGEKGDEMIRRLADRLVAVDLLGRAAELLENQVRFRLQGLDKARVGARLAYVHLADRKPEKALEILKLSQTDVKLPEDLARQRRHFETRALMDLDRLTPALAVLEGDSSREAELLRGEIYWKNGDWANASQIYGRMVLGMNKKRGDKLNETEARNVLNLAIALSLNKNEQSLRNLREYFLPAMDAGPFRDAFRMIANPESSGMINYRAVAEQVSQAESFQAFMTNYRQKVQSGRLSAIN